MFLSFFLVLVFKVLVNFEIKIIKKRFFRIMLKVVVFYLLDYICYFLFVFI